MDNHLIGLFIDPIFLLKVVVVVVFFFCFTFLKYITSDEFNITHK